MTQRPQNLDDMNASSSLPPLSGSPGCPWGNSIFHLLVLYGMMDMYNYVEQLWYAGDYPHLPPWPPLGS